MEKGEKKKKIELRENKLYKSLGFHIMEALCDDSHDT